MAKLDEIEESIRKAREGVAKVGAGVQELAEKKFVPPTTSEGIAEADKATLAGLQADQLKEGGDFKITDPIIEQKDTTLANGFLERMKQAAEDEEKRIEQERKDREAKAAKEEATKKKTLAEKFGLTREEKRGEEYEELGYEPSAYFTERKADIAELEGIWTSYNDKVTARDAAVAQIEGRPGMSLEFMNRESTRITNQYNIEINRIAAQINTKSAIMAQKQGLMNEARAFVKEAVDDYTYDMQLAYEQFETFREENKEDIDELDDEYKDALDKAEALDYQIWQETKAEKNSVMELMLENRNAGITIDDTLDEAVKKAAAVSDEELLSVAEAKSLGVPYGTTKAAAYGVTPSVGAGYEARLNQEISNLYSGRYGVEGAREKVIGILQGEFPGKDIGGDIYRRVPNGYEASIKGPPAKDKWELEGDVWAWLATPEAGGLSDEEKATQIKGYGLSPETFGIYE